MTRTCHSQTLQTNTRHHEEETSCLCHQCFVFLSQIVIPAETACVLSFILPSKFWLMSGYAFQKFLAQLVNVFLFLIKLCNFAQHFGLEHSKLQSARRFRFRNNNLELINKIQETIEYDHKILQSIPHTKPHHREEEAQNTDRHTTERTLSKYKNLFSITQQDNCKARNY